MMKKDGKNIVSKKEESVQKNSSVLNALKQLSVKDTESDKAEESEHIFPTSLNEELEELLRKDKKRFFGGCGG